MEGFYPLSKISLHKTTNTRQDTDECSLTTKFLLGSQNIHMWSHCASRDAASNIIAKGTQKPMKRGEKKTKKGPTLSNLEHFDTKANKFLVSCHNFRATFATNYALWQVKWLRRADGFQQACLPKNTRRVRSPLCEFSGRSRLAEVLLHCSPVTSKQLEQFVHGCCYRTDAGTSWWKPAFCRHCSNRLDGTSLLLLVAPRRRVDASSFTVR